MKPVSTALLILLALALAHPVLAEETKGEAPPPPAPPSQEQMLLQNLVGKWTLTATGKLPDGTTLTGTGSAELAAVGGGKGAAGPIEMNIEGGLHLEHGLMFGYDIWTKKVHFYAVGNRGEVHDHSGPMTGENSCRLVWEGLKDGKPASEDITMTITKDEIAFVNTETADGKPAGVFTFVLKRAK